MSSVHGKPEHPSASEVTDPPDKWAQTGQAEAAGERPGPTARGESRIVSLLTRRVYLYPIVPLVVLAIWYMVTQYTAYFPPILLPTPNRVVRTARSLIASGELLSHIEVSLKRILVGITASTSLAIPLGIFMGISRTFEKLADGLVTLLRPIPPLAWVPLAVLWLGIGNATVIFITSLAGFFVILVNTIAGVKGVDRVLLMAAMSLGAKGGTLILTVVLPAAIPTMITAVRIAVGVSWMSIVAAEFVAASEGLGYLITFYQDVLRTDVVIVGMAVIGALGISMDFLLRRLERLLVPWHEDQKVGG